MNHTIASQYKEHRTFWIYYLGSQAAIMFLASNICWVSSGTVRALNFKVSKRVPRNNCSYCCRNVTANYHLLCKCYTVCFCMGGEGGFRGKSMEKFWIRSAGRNLLSHEQWLYSGRRSAGGERICATGHDLRPSFCSLVFFVDPDHREIVLLRYF